MRDYPDFIIAIAYVKLAAIETNHTLGVINDEISGAIGQACREIIDGKWHENFPIDMYRVAQYICQHECQRGYRQPCTRNHGT